MIEIKSATKTFEQVKALDNVSFSIAPGEIVGFVGVNGSGKSTTMRSIMGLIPLDSGSITINSETNSDRSLISKSIGYMPEQRGLYNKDKIYDQLAFFGELHGIDTLLLEKKITANLEKLGIKSKRFLKLNELSLGNQQRVQLAVSLLHDPQYLILDEPFNGLDPMGVDYLIELLKEKRSHGVGTLFSSHILPFIEELCDRIVFIHKGRILTQISIPDLVSSHGVTYRVEGDEELMSELTLAINHSGGSFTLNSQSAGALTFSSIAGSASNDIGAILASISRINEIKSISTSRPSLKEYYKQLVDSAHE